MNPIADTLPAEAAASQSLANGAAGTALLHIERALTGTGTWASAHAQVRQASGGPVDGSEHTALYYGAPAIAVVLHAAAADGVPRYRLAANTLDAHVERLARRRLEAAARRVTRGTAATFAEYDLFYGLTGIGVALLHRLPVSDTLAEVLRYVIGLTQPRREDGEELPGWWVGHDPDPILPTPGGHVNAGMAHGAAGLLALLALATRRNLVVDGQAEAIDSLTAWFDRWRQDSPDGPWWPQWLTRADLRSGRPSQPGPGRPSWCYGAVGVARALQLAAIATNDSTQRQDAEDAMAACLSDRQLHRITEAGLCHGMAGVYQTAYRAAHDADTPAIRQRLPMLADALAKRAATSQHTATAGFLTGSAGVDLTLETVRHTTPPRTGWDACLLIT